MITLEDVAKEAGVSSSTVSIVVNNRSVRGVSVSSTTRQRVLSVAQRLGYTPNSLARAVATGKNRVFGLIKDDLASELSMRIMVGAQEECEKDDYLIKPFRLADSTSIGSVVRKCLGQRVAGIITVNLSDDAMDTILREATLAGVSVVMVDSPSRTADCLQITSDAEQGIRLLCEHLIRLGHTRMGFVGGPANSIISQDRKLVFQTICREHGVDVRQEHVVDSSWGDNTIVDAAVTPLLMEPTKTRPTALFCAGDPIAMMTIRAARRLGFALPKDLSVIGYSNASFAYLCDPSLTTIAQDFVEMGREAVRYLMDPDRNKTMLNGSNIVKVPTTLMLRESVWGPAS